MKVITATARDVSRSVRYDAKFHLSRHNPLLMQLRAGNWPTSTIAEMFGRKNVWTGNIFSRVYASSLDHGKPLLVPYDVFRYVPWSDKILSRTQVAQFARLEVQRGAIFIVCSGRNLGPVTIADSYCERFTMSHDMVRIDGELNDDKFYVAAFLSTAHGQATIRTDMNGSVIDHTDAKQVAALQIPQVSDSLRKEVAALFRVGFESRERARLLLEATHLDFLKHLGLSDWMAEANVSRRSSASRSTIGKRFDAEPQMPLYSDLKRMIRDAGGVPLSSVAQVRKPASRYKTNYVADAELGLLMMNGRQISQYLPIALQPMSMLGFKNASDFVVRCGMTLLTSDGRAEENLADCVMVTKERDGWGASGHVHRVVPLEGINPGLVYLACACAPSQLLLKAAATGSVVDALSEADVASTIVPFSTSGEAQAIGDRAVGAWDLFASAAQAEAQAIELLQREFAKSA